MICKWNAPSRITWPSYSFRKLYQERFLPFSMLFSTIERWMHALLVISSSMDAETCCSRHLFTDGRWRAAFSTLLHWRALRSCISWRFFAVGCWWVHHSPINASACTSTACFKFSKEKPTSWLPFGKVFSWGLHLYIKRLNVRWDCPPLVARWYSVG